MVEMLVTDLALLPTSSSSLSLTSVGTYAKDCEGKI